MNQVGLTNVFDNAIGTSTGAPTVSYFVAGQGALGTNIYCQDLPENHFVSLQRGLHGKSVIDIDIACDVFNGNIGNKELDKKALLESRTNVYIVTTEYQTGKSVIFSVDGSTDPVDLMRASSALPVLYKKPVFINGVRYVDGGIGMYFPAREIIEDMNPTDILVLANRAVDTKESIVERIVESLAVKGLPRDLQDGILQRNNVMLHNLNQLRADISRRYVIVWSDGLIKANEMDPEKLRKGASNAYKHMMRVLQTYGR